MGERYMTMAELDREYPGEWVLLDRPRLDRGGQVAGGYLLYHDRSRDEFDKRSLQFQTPHRAFLYIFEPGEEDIEFTPRWHEAVSTPPADSSMSGPG